MRKHRLGAMFIANNRFILTLEVNRITIPKLRPVARLELTAAGLAEKVHVRGRS